MPINITDEFHAATTKGKIASAKEVFLTGDTENLQQIGEKTHQLEDSIKNIATTGGASTAAAVAFDNAASGMTAVTAQGAIDEVNSKVHDLSSAVTLQGIENTFYPSDINYETETEDIVYAIVSNNGHLLFGIRADGSIIQYSIEENAKKHIDVLRNAIESLTNTLNSNKNTQDNTNKDIYDKISLGKSTTDEPIYLKDAIEITDANEYVWVVVDANNKILCGIKEDGSFNWFIGIPEHIKSFVKKESNGYILPNNSCNTIQKSSQTIDKGILGIQWQNTLNRSDNPLIGVRWMLDNLDISKFECGLYISNIEDSEQTTIKLLNSCIKMMNEKGIKVKVINMHFPDWKNVSGKVPMEKYLKVIDTIVSYDGHNMKELPDGSSYPCLIDEIAFLDEIESHVGHTPLELLELLDYLVSYTKNKRSNIKVCSPSSGSYNKLYHVIGSLKLPNGHTYSDLFDTYDIDVWTKDLDYTTKNILKSYAASDPIKSYDKKMTAIVGFSTIAYTQEEQAEKFIQHTLKYLSYGASVFSPFAPDYFIGSYYILGVKATNADHLYVRCGDNNELSITDGDGYDDIILRIGDSYWRNGTVLLTSTVSAKALKVKSNLQNHGLYLRGSEGLILSKVTIKKDDGSQNNDIWSGEQNIFDNPLVLDKNLFSTLAGGDEIIITTKNAKIASGLTEVIPRKAAIALKYLCSILHKGCTRPSVKVIDNITIAMWNDSSGRPIYVLWSNKQSSKVSLDILGNYFITDIVGNILSLDLTNVELNNMIIIRNSNGIKFN